MRKILPYILLIVGLGMVFFKPIYNRIAPAVLDIKISTPPVIMSSIYKVYANEDAFDGKYSLFKMIIKNTSNVDAKNVEVQYKMSNFLDWTIAEKMPLVLAGQTVVVNCYPKFPDKMGEKTTDSKENVKLVIKADNIKTIENNFTITVKSRNSFMYNFLPADEIRTAADYYDNIPLLACYVTPNDPVIKYYTQQIQQKILKGETAGVGNNEAEGIRFLKGIYNATLLAHMVYSGTSGVPENVNDVSSIVQNIRMPREVVTGKTGLCIELSLLYASIMANAGMDPVIYLVPGHAYPGFKMNNNYYAIESTAIGGEGLGGSKTADEAFDMAMNNKEAFIQKLQEGDERYNVIEIRENIKLGAVAPELKDDDFLRKKVDEIAASFGGTPTPSAEQTKPGDKKDDKQDEVSITKTAPVAPTPTTQQKETQIPQGYKAFKGVVNFAYPADWEMMEPNRYYSPACKNIISNQARNATVEVYKFTGITNPKAALESINDWQKKASGFSLKYKLQMVEEGYSVFKGSTVNGKSTAVNWVAALKVLGNDVVGIIVNATAYTGNTHEKTLLTILNTLQ
ncbi:MAG: hypothetical protein JST34_05135 [Bacteroidetes bacterium]|nr:hypothetical protein [Bacteroidota bacterium]MCB0707793.1 hypothetical protein [Chitinophagaceae bacterium]